MALPRRRASYNYGFDPGSQLEHGHPDTLYPPEGYCLLECELHRATTSLQVGTFPFLSQLNLRSAINLSAEPLHDKAIEFFRSTGVTLLTPRSLDAFDGPYDLWEEAAKESLELLLDADNQPMMLLDSPTENEAACLIGCLRRLQHWSICAIHDEYHMLTMKSTRYGTNQRFIERFDLELVTLNANRLPSWFKEHLDMLDDERKAEDDLSKRDPQHCGASYYDSWTRGFSSIGENLPATAPISRSGSTTVADVSPTVPEGNDPLTEEQCSPEPSSNAAGEGSCNEPGNDVGQLDEAKVEEIGQESHVEGQDGNVRERTGGVTFGAIDGVKADTVPDYRLNGFVYVCPLVSEGCKFTAKAWLQDEDDG